MDPMDHGTYGHKPRQERQHGILSGSSTLWKITRFKFSGAICHFHVGLPPSGIPLKTAPISLHHLPLHLITECVTKLLDGWKTPISLWFMVL